MPKLTDFSTIDECPYDGALVLAKRNNANEYIPYMITGYLKRSSEYVVMSEDFEYFTFPDDQKMDEYIKLCKEELEEKRKLYGP